MWHYCQNRIKIRWWGLFIEYDWGVRERCYFSLTSLWLNFLWNVSKVVGVLPLVQQCLLLLLLYYYCVWRPPSDFLTFFLKVEFVKPWTRRSLRVSLETPYMDVVALFPWQHCDLFSHRDAETLTSMLHPNRWQQICAAAYRIDLKPFWEVVCGLRCLPPPGGNQDTRASFRAISRLTTFYKHFFLVVFFFIACKVFFLQQPPTEKSYVG